MSTTKDELNKIAIEYHDNDNLKDKFIEDECQFYTYDWVFKNIADNSKILELGFGEGNFTEELIKRNFKPTVIDGSDFLLNKAKELYGDSINTINLLFEEYNPSDKYDCIIATHVLEHLDNPYELLIKMKSWLNPNGIIIIIVPNKESIHRQLAVQMGIQKELDSLSPRDIVVGHQRVYSIETLSKDVLNAGYNVEDVKGFFLKPLPNSMMLDYSLELIKALNSISTIIPNHLLANIGLIAKI
jgi:2-polyprenyl-3-methyl-5-hydroxy-6-metoxy-1,4-benzoquinol methylase